MIINTTEEGSRSVLTDIPREKVATARVLIEEGGDIVDEASNENEWALRRLLLDCVDQVNQSPSRSGED